MSLWADAIGPPEHAELLYEDSGIARPDRWGCWAVWMDRVYGTGDPNEAVLTHYDQSLGDSEEWVRNANIVSDDSAVYDHPDGTSIHISTDIAYDFPEQVEKYQALYKTLFYVVITARPAEVRERCREY